MRKVLSRAFAFGNDCDGVAGLEAGLVLSAFMAIVLGSLAWSFYLWELSSYQFAVQQAARCAGIINSGANVKCGSFNSFDTFGASKATGVPGVSKTFFTYAAGSTGYTNSSNVGATSQTACVTSNFINVLLANVARVPASGREMFCRPMS